MLKLLVEKVDGSTVEVALVPHKDKSGYSYINLTKGHICPCKFKSILEALKDMDKDPKVKQYKRIK